MENNKKIVKKLPEELRLAIGKRLRELRESKQNPSWSQTDMANKLMEAGLTSHGFDEDDNENSKNTISGLELGKRSITIPLALAYAGVFGVSLDYILCRTDYWQSEDKAIKDLLGLSNKSINVLKTAYALVQNAGEYKKLISEKLDKGEINLEEFFAQNQNLADAENLIRTIETLLTGGKK